MTPNLHSAAPWLSAFLHLGSARDRAARREVPTVEDARRWQRDTMAGLTVPNKSQLTGRLPVGTSDVKLIATVVYRTALQEIEYIRVVDPDPASEKD